ncbi:hypothetical protein RHGRI_038493 [Rhododendron griersonianum]|uniref:Uncharacterized protein n=1 Tax=Rhododendron griersonianum TaxID=479676 RepID=A0AAV6HJZ6_9ERIC|nr:hypothetical protein RHGRI_038493 [Rhododendron griersonianum]
MLHHLSPRIFHHRILMLWVMRHLFLSLMAQHHGSGLEVLSHVFSFSPMNALVFLIFLFHFCRLDNLLVSARMFPDSVIFWCQAVLQNTVAEQSNPSSQSSCKNQGIIRGLEP